MILSREWEGGSSSNIYDVKVLMVNHFASKLTFTMKDLDEKLIEGKIQNNSIRQFVLRQQTRNLLGSTHGVLLNYQDDFNEIFSSDSETISSTWMREFTGEVMNYPCITKSRFRLSESTLVEATRCVNGCIRQIMVTFHLKNDIGIRYIVLRCSAALSMIHVWRPTCVRHIHHSFRIQVFLVFEKNSFMISSKFLIKTVLINRKNFMNVA